MLSRATDALAAAYAAQVGLGAEPWPAGARLTVRFAVQSGESVERTRDYVGPAVNRAARLRSVAQGGEVLVSESTAQLTADLTEVEFSSGWSAGERLEPGVPIKEALIEARRSATPGGASAT